MKKLISLLLALAMMLGCMAFAEGVDYTGVWVLTGIDASDYMIGPTALAKLGMNDVTLTIHADGTSVLALGASPETYPWTQSEDGIVLNVDGDMQHLIYHLDVLYFVQDDDMLMFTREGATPAIDDAFPAAVLAQVDPAAFEGKWLLTSKTISSIALQAEEMDAYMALELFDGKCLYTYVEENGEKFTTEMIYTVEEVEGVGTVATVETLDETTGETTEFLALNMLENGWLYSAVDSDGMKADCFYTRQAEETAE